MKLGNTATRKRLEELAQKAVLRFGTTFQKKIAVEESAELIVAIQHYDRLRIKKEDVLSEIADIEIVIEQLKLIFADPVYPEILNRKLDKLENHINA